MTGELLTLPSVLKTLIPRRTMRLVTSGKSVVELSGDFTPDIRALQNADVIITTPEKWDGISRHWQHRSYVQEVGLVVIDEIHLLGQERGESGAPQTMTVHHNLGPILEVIVSRMRYISAACKSTVRFVGLSTALANATDIADWLGVGRMGLFNFRPAVRPVPCTVFVAGDFTTVILQSLIHPLRLFREVLLPTNGQHESVGVSTDS